MKPEEKTQYKAEVQAALYEYLKNNNLMQSRNEDVMSHLPNMYRHLEEKGLIKFGLTWAFFQNSANDAFMMALMRGLE
jgi:hypothetical protein